MNRFQHAQLFVVFLFLFFFFNTLLFQWGSKNDLKKYETTFNTVITNTSQQYFNMPEMLIDSDGIYFQSIVLEF